MSENNIDTTAFLSARFDVNVYANAILSGREYRPDEISEDKTPGSKGDVSLELARLNYGIVSSYP
jgi:hypothetical protein